MRILTDVAACDPKINKNNFGAGRWIPVIWPQQDVVWLQVAVEVAEFVQTLQSVKELQADLNSSLYAKSLVDWATDHLLNTGPVAPHDDEVKVAPHLPTCYDLWEPLGLARLQFFEYLDLGLDTAELRLGHRDLNKD